MSEVVDPSTGEILRHNEAAFLPADDDAVQIGQLYLGAKLTIVQSVRNVHEAGRRLAKKKDELPHGEWLAWLEQQRDVLGFDRKTAAKLMKFSNVALARHLDADEALKLSRQLWGHGPTNHLTNGTGQNEWYTPPEVVERVTAALGGIDLDPASNDEANATVGAERYFTIEDDGLAQEWSGRVWLNPPYSRDLMPAFVTKLIAEYQSGRVTDAVLVSHNNTETQWFQSLANVAAAICFPSQRIKFYRGDDVAAPVNGQVFFYLGERVENFCREFADMGVIVRSIYLGSAQ